MLIEKTRQEGKTFRGESLVYGAIDGDRSIGG